MRKTVFLTCFAVSSLLTLTHAGQAKAQLSFERVPIEYSKTEPNDPVAKLNKQIQAGTINLTYDSQFGYLKSLLTKLDLPVSSQTLVFAKNSLQRSKISPANPRAIFFNDETYLGYVPGGDLIEIASTDPMLGTVFYTISQHTEVSAAKIVRKTDQCLFCHASSHTGRVPGLIMQSVFTNSNGHRVFPQESFSPSATGAMHGRWAGWFVTGHHGQQQHLGNLMIDSDDVVTSDRDFGNGNVVDLSRWFDHQKHLTPHSDLVALLVLQHQVTMHNRLTDANHRARLLLHQTSQRNRGRETANDQLEDEDAIAFDQIAEEVVDALLMVGEAVFSEPVSGTSRFAEEFAGRGPTDPMGRSLRSLDLRRSLFKHPCSYLIYSPSFDSLPKPLLDRVYNRLLRVLKNQDKRKKYSHLTVENRRAILEILRSTKAGFPDS